MYAELVNETDLGGACRCIIRHLHSCNSAIMRCLTIISLLTRSFAANYIFSHCNNLIQRWEKLSTMQSTLSSHFVYYHQLGMRSCNSLLRPRDIKFYK